MPTQAPTQQSTPVQQRGSASEYQGMGPQSIAGRRVTINYTGSGADIFGRILLWGLLTALTIGIYSGWAINNFYKYVIEHTVVEIP